jgi:MinD superfamily P-loop ATPase
VKARNGMKIAVASGKGGTGKTTLAASLALSLAADRGWIHPASGPPLFLDCDVEAPNAHLFLKPEFNQRQEVAVLIPEVDEGLCTHCGQCVEVCSYHAIAVLGNKTLVFPQLCHGCGSCSLICPQGAISEIPQPVGVLEHGIGLNGIRFARGVLNIGEPMAVPVIRQLKKWMLADDDRITILDAPPGASCPVVETLRGVDFLLLVTEPTPFGLHDLKLAAQVADELRLPAGVVINRDGIGDAGVEDFCRDEGLPILMRIPFERAIAEGLARGQNLVEIHPEYTPRFKRLLAGIVQRCMVEVSP